MTDIRTEIQKLLADDEAADQNEATLRLAEAIAKRIEQSIDALVVGKAVVTREELQEVYGPIFAALSDLQSVIFRTATARLQEHGFHEQVNGKWRRPAGKAR